MKKILFFFLSLIFCISYFSCTQVEEHDSPKTRIYLLPKVLMNVSEEENEAPQIRPSKFLIKFNRIIDSSFVNEGIKLECKEINGNNWNTYDKILIGRNSRLANVIEIATPSSTVNVELTSDNECIATDNPLFPKDLIFRLTISKSIKSEDGVYPEKDFVYYFSTKKNESGLSVVTDPQGTPNEEAAPSFSELNEICFYFNDSIFSSSTTDINNKTILDYITLEYKNSNGNFIDMQDTIQQSFISYDNNIFSIFLKDKVFTKKELLRLTVRKELTSKHLLNLENDYVAYFFTKTLKQVIQNNLSIKLDTEYSTLDDGATIIADNPKEAIFYFSEEIGIDQLTKEKFKLINTDNNNVEVPITLELGENDFHQVKMKWEQDLIYGDDYKIFVSKNVTTYPKYNDDGLILNEDFTRHFCISSIERYAKENVINRNGTIIISDIHMGDERANKYTNGKAYGWFIKNQKKLETFLNSIVNSTIKELVIAGDLVDEWVAPMEVKPFGDNDNDTETTLLNSIKNANKMIIEGFQKVKNAGIEIHYVPGNHDMLINQEKLNFLFGNNIVTFENGNEGDKDPEGLGYYEPNNFMRIEHGHRMDFYNSPDPFSNKDQMKNGNIPIIPAGFFVTKMASTSDLEKITSITVDEESFLSWSPINWTEYYASWKLIRSKKPTNINASEWETNCFNIYGFGGFKAKGYSFNDIMPQIGTDVRILYKTAYENSEWKKRQKHNKVPDLISFESGLLVGGSESWCDNKNMEQYLESKESPLRILVIGHTHKPVLNYKKYSYGFLRLRDSKATVYANAGSWIDPQWTNNDCTFVYVIPNSSRKTCEIHLYQFNTSLTSSKRIKAYKLDNLDF